MSQFVVAIIKGGLGNQLFSYAAARAFAIRRKRELLIDDASGFVRDGYGRSFRLDQFPIVGDPAPKRYRLGDPKGFKHKAVRSWNKLLPLSRRNYLAEKTGMPPEGLLGFRSDRRVLYLNGYWQREDYFIDYADRIRLELEPPAFEKEENLELEKELGSGPSVFVHIRRGAYSPKLTAGYYRTAIENARGSNPDSRFEVFGDDHEWAREYLGLKGKNVRFHDGDGSDELRDFRLMAACRHAIVANSSFSWWAAWLRPSPNKRVWTPANPGWPVQAASGWHKVPNELEA
ncbi:MAG: alpha-1,2-fucosyltransferase [Verrucomicrobiota bacterium]